MQKVAGNPTHIHLAESHKRNEAVEKQMDSCCTKIDRLRQELQDAEEHQERAGTYTNISRCCRQPNMDHNPGSLATLGMHHGRANSRPQGSCST